MAIDFRGDEPHNVSYPTTPDTRGTARVYHLRKPYYLGHHDSPLSYVMFGLWKHHLTTKGSVPSTAEIREQAEHLLYIKPPVIRKHASKLTMGLLMTLALLIGSLVGANFRSSSKSTNVDGIPLSANELDFIRQFRDMQESADSRFRQAVNRRSPELISGVMQQRMSKDEIARRIRGF